MSGAVLSNVYTHTQRAVETKTVATAADTVMIFN